MANFSKIFFVNKKALTLILGVALFLVLTPSGSVQAAWWDELIGGVADLGLTILTLPFWIAVFPFVILLAFVAPLLSFVVFVISLFFLRMAAEGYLVTLQFTHGGVVDQGLAATTSLVNLGFILVLVFMAIATILRLQSYGLKKLLPKFIFIVLLINFIPVITGAVIDVANIVTKSFLDFDITNTFIKIFNPLQGDINNIRAIIDGDATKVISEVRSIVGFSGIIQRVLNGVMISFFGLFAAFVFGLYFILFLLRYIVLWILVILAPVAWFCWILPRTQSVSKAWWNYFLQWAFIGVIAGFFLKLGGVAVSALAGGFGNVATPQIGGGWQPVLNIFGFIFETVNSIFLFVAVLAFLLIGFFISIKTAGGGTDIALKWGERGLKAAGKFAATQTGGRLLATEAGKKWMGRLEQTQLGMSWKGASGWRKAATALSAPVAYPARWGIRAAATAGLKYGAQQAQSVEQEKDKIKKQFGGDYQRAAATFPSIVTSNWHKKIAMGSYLTETKGNTGFSQLTPDQRADVIENTARYMPNKLGDLIKHTPDIIEETEAQKIFGPEKGRAVSELLKKTLVPDGIGRDPLTLRYKDGDVQKLADQGTEEAHLVKEAAFKKAVDAMKTSDLDTVDPSLGSSVAFQRAVTKWKNNTAFLQKSFEKWGPEFIEKIQAQAEKIDYTLKSVAKTNPSLLKMSYTPFGKTFMRPWTVKRTASDRGNILGKNRAQDLVLAAGREAPSWSPIKGLPEIKPVSSEQEKIKFANIAEGTKKPSPAIDQNALREVQGGINALAYRMRENQNEINKKLGEISRASAEEKELLGTKLSTFQEKKARYKSTDETLKDRADLIAERLSREVAEKVRKKRRS